MSKFATSEEDANWQAAADIEQPEQRTELANARRFIELHGENLCYVPPWDKWIIWQGTHWQVDAGCTVEGMTRPIVDNVWHGTYDKIREVERAEAQAMLSFARQTSSANGIRNMLQLARSEPGVAIMPARLDSDQWLFSVQNGVIDLQSGRRRAHSKTDFITKLSPVVHSDRVRSPRWEQFVLEVMAGDEQLAGFLKRLVGYWLTGSVREHILPIFHGAGANGKSVFLSTIESLFGTDYALHAPPDLLLVKRHESHPTERADLFGKRLVVVQETEAGKRLAESLVKELTGGDRIRARRMREDFWEFSPTHKIVMSTNSRPIVTGVDHGIWRRLRLVPFNRTFATHEQDKSLTETLRRELTGILTWAIEGCLDWQKHGLAEPASVLAATEQYRDEQDLLADFFDERCIIGEREKVAAGKLYEAYAAWCRTNGTDPDNATVFGRKLSERGYPRANASGGVKMRMGIGLRFDSSTY